MKFYVQQGTGTGARYTEASDAMLVAAVIGILHRHGLLDTADQLTTALIHKAIGVPLPLTPLPQQLPQKRTRTRRKPLPTPEDGKATGDDPAQSETASPFPQCISYRESHGVALRCHLDEGHEGDHMAHSSTGEIRW